MLPVLRRTWLVLGLSLALSLCLLAGTQREAAAAQDLAGAATFSVSGWGLAPHCDVTCAAGEYAKLPWTGPETTSQSVWFFAASTSPTSLPNWPNPPVAALDSGSMGSASVASGTAASLAWSALPAAATTVYFVLTPLRNSCVTNGDQTTDSPCAARVLFERGATAPTTTAPTTTTAPSTTEPADPSDPSDPPPGGTISCVESAPCFVHVVNPVPVDVGSIEVSALTEEQWGEIWLALGALVFFSAASFVSGWRHGRSK